MDEELEGLIRDLGAAVAGLCAFLLACALVVILVLTRA